MGNGPYTPGNGPQPKSRLPRSHGDANKKSSSSAVGPIAGIVYSIVAGVGVVIIGVAAYMVHGYGLI